MEGIFLAENNLNESVIFETLMQIEAKESDEKLEEEEKLENCIKINQSVSDEIFKAALKKVADQEKNLKAIHCLTTSKGNVRRLNEPKYLSDEVAKKIKPIKKALLDYDGTLREIQEEPMDAVPTKEVLDFILKNKEKIIICTGRSKEICDIWFPKGIIVYAEHGALFRSVEGNWSVAFCNKKDINVDNLSESNLIDKNVVDILNYYAKRTLGSELEKKSCGYAFHYRQCEGESINPVIKQLFMDLIKIQKTYNFIISPGKKVIEVKLASKEDVMRKENPCLAAGDDKTDEDMFFVAQDGCITIKIGKEETSAEFFVNDVPDFYEKLEILLNNK
ncbi:hypothetical protein NUSPORA_01105 [Nucleospora cyclopteri]